MGHNGLYKDITPIMENQMEKKIENEMENWGYIEVRMMRNVAYVLPLHSCSSMCPSSVSQFHSMAPNLV